MADMFGREPVQLKQPITADKCEITWDGDVVGQAIQFSLEYSQQMTRRRSIGSKDAIVYGSQPVGRASMARLYTADGPKSAGDSWSCKTGNMTFTMGGCEGAGGKTYHATGCVVTSFQIQASAEDLSVMDNITIEFLELTAG